MEWQLSQDLGVTADKYGNKFCQYYVEDMLELFPNASATEVEELMDAHRCFRRLLQS